MATKPCINTDFGSSLTAKSSCIKCVFVCVLTHLGVGSALASWKPELHSRFYPAVWSHRSPTWWSKPPEICAWPLECFGIPDRITHSRSDTNTPVLHLLFAAINTHTNMVQHKYNGTIHVNQLPTHPTLFFYSSRGTPVFFICSLSFQTVCVSKNKNKNKDSLCEIVCLTGKKKIKDCFEAESVFLSFLRFSLSVHHIWVSSIVLVVPLSSPTKTDVYWHM